MYISFSFENFVTIGVILILWMVALHALAQIGLRVPGWLNLGGS